MALPKIKYPTYSIVQPSNGKDIKFRPFTVAEEKVLLTAMQGEDAGEITESIKHIIDSCFMGTVDIEEATSYDVEYMFIQLRSKSISNIIDMRFVHKGCELAKEGEEGTAVNVQINIDEARVQVYDSELKEYVDYVPSKKNSKGVAIELENGLGVVVKHPNLKTVSKYDLTSADSELLYSMIKSCIVMVYDEEEMYTEFSKEDLDNFFISLTSKHKEKLVDFISNIPRLRYVSTFRCRCGYEEPIVFEGLESFFA